MERIRFTNRQGLKLAGCLHQPGCRPLAGVVLTHGFRGTMEGGGKAVELAERLAGMGYLVFRFDFAGAGESEGDFSSITLSRQVSDLKSSLDWLEGQFNLPWLAVGRSFGGSTALAAAAVDHRIKALCLWATPLDLIRTFRNALGRLYDNLLAGQEVAVTDDHGQTFTLKPEFIEDLCRYDLYQKLKEVAGRPILFLHGALDSTVDLAQVKRGFKQAEPPKEMVIVPDGDHQFTRTWQKAWDALFDWLNRIV